MRDVVFGDRRAANFGDVLLNLWNSMIQAKAMKDYTAFFELVDLFEKFLAPYADKDYEDELREIEAEPSKKKVYGETPAQTAAIRNAMYKRKMEKKLEALMRLAQRKGLIPLAKTSGGDRA